MEKEHIRFYVFIRFKLGINATDIHRELCDAWGESYVSYRCVAKWIHEFMRTESRLKMQLALVDCG